MSARVSNEVDPTVAQPLALAGSGQANLVAAIGFEADDRFNGSGLPSDHPHWMKDTLSISQRARTLLQKLKPIVLRVLTAWDHRVRSIAIGERTLRIDASGCYRFD